MANNTPPVAKQVIYDDQYFPLNLAPQVVGFGRNPSELATDKQTKLKARNFKITSVSLDGTAYSAQKAGIEIFGGEEMFVGFNLRKKAYRPFRFREDPVEVKVNFSVNDGEGLEDTGSYSFFVTGYQPHNERSVRGTSGNDKIIGGSKRNAINGGNGDDVIMGLENRDLLRGGNGSDVLDGGSDADILIGGAGDDVLMGGSGNDKLKGGLGADIFVVSSGMDRLQDVKLAQGDVIEIAGDMEYELVSKGRNVRLMLDDGSKTFIKNMTVSAMEEGALQLV